MGKRSVTAGLARSLQLSLRVCCGACLSDADDTDSKALVGVRSDSAALAALDVISGPSVVADSASDEVAALFPSVTGVSTETLTSSRLLLVIEPTSAVDMGWLVVQRPSPGV